MAGVAAPSHRPPDSAANGSSEPEDRPFFLCRCKGTRSSLRLPWSLRAPRPPALRVAVVVRRLLLFPLSVPSAMAPFPADLWHGSSQLFNRLKSYYVKEAGTYAPNATPLIAPPRPRRRPRRRRPFPSGSACSCGWSAARGQPIPPPRALAPALCPPRSVGWSVGRPVGRSACLPVSVSVSVSTRPSLTHRETRASAGIQTRERHHLVDLALRRAHHASPIPWPSPPPPHPTPPRHIHIHEYIHI